MTLRVPLCRRLAPNVEIVDSEVVDDGSEELVTGAALSSGI